MHIFPYSRRPGTPAAEMAGQVLNAVKEERARRAAGLAARMERAWLESWIGRTVPVLFEEKRNGLWFGHTGQYAPAAVSCGETLHNRIVPILAESAENGILLGTPASDFSSPQA